MNIDEYIEMIDSDAEINRKDLLEESIKIPKLISKYQRHYVIESKILKEAQGLLDKKRLQVYQYYSGDSTDEDYKKRPLNKKPLKTDIEKYYIPADTDYQELEKKISNQSLKVKIIEDQLKSISQRGYLIKTALDWEKFKNGLS